MKEEWRRRGLTARNGKDAKPVADGGGRDGDGDGQEAEDVKTGRVTMHRRRMAEEPRIALMTRMEGCHPSPHP
jgi:hypothetical protein